ncbi:MAG: hypothetical protein ABWZ54_10230 [Luteibacter sp.]
MASIYTGLAFMHGHIVDRELVLRLGREEPPADRGAGAAARPAKTTRERKVDPTIPPQCACVGCC